MQNVGGPSDEGGKGKKSEKEEEGQPGYFNEAGALIDFKGTCCWDVWDQGANRVRFTKGEHSLTTRLPPSQRAVDDANAVSIITERVSDTESRLWTSTIGNVVVYRQVNGASGLQRLASFDHGRNTRFHGASVAG